jgi:ATP-dependent RNA helicase DOB1
LFLKKISVDNEKSVQSYLELMAIYEDVSEQVRAEVIKPIHIIPFIQPGRLIYVKSDNVDWGWGVVVNFKKVKSFTSKYGGNSAKYKYTVDALLNCTKASKNKLQLQIPKPSKMGEESEMMVVPIELNSIYKISKLRAYMPKDLTKKRALKQVRNSIMDISAKFPSGIPQLDPITDLEIEKRGFYKLTRVAFNVFF